MPVSLSTQDIARKNMLADAGAWLLHIAISVTGIRTLGYDGSTKNFLPGGILTGDDSSARARIISATTTSTSGGTLTLYNVNGAFWDNEIIRDDATAEATATVNGVLSTTIDTIYRYVKNTSNTTWNGSAWTKRAIDLDVVRQSADGVAKEARIQINDLSTEDTLSERIDECQGLIGESVSICYVHSCFLSSTAAVINEDYRINECSKGQQWAMFSLIVPDAEPMSFPRRKYDNLHCQWQYKATATCQMATDSTYLTCDHTLGDCIDRDNVEHFGSYPGIPGGEFD